MTERLYYTDSYLTQFSAIITEVLDGGRRVYLDRTAFYPTSGGQPFDTGKLGNASVTDVVDEGDRILHVLDSPLEPGAIGGTVDWPRRFDHMQQHTGQHVLSAIFTERFGLSTISFHLGREFSTLDLDALSVEPSVLEQAERIANEEVAGNRAVTVIYEDQSTAAGLRKASERAGTLRIVSIEGLDRSACGGTHVRATGEIGSILLRQTEKVRKATRIEFVCGLRAVAAARRDWLGLKEQAATFQERIGELEKDRRKLIAELASYRGRELYSSSEIAADGLRRALRRVDEIDDAIRAEAQAYIAGGRAIYLAVAGSSVLLAASPDSNLNAGARIKQIATRGGGSATIAQGSVADPEAAIRALLAGFHS